MNKFVRLNVTAEGRSEEQFIKNVLSTHLGKYNISTDVRCVLTSKDKNKSHRGGLISYAKAKKDIQTWMKEDKNQNVFFTTMFDLFSLPEDFPSFHKCKEISDPYEKIECLENALKKDINDYRFIPYIQLHEFETFLFVNIEMLKLEYFDHKYSSAIKSLLRISDEIENPELINDGDDTSPSKRIIKVIPEFEHNKISVGAAITEIIGIDNLISHCQHFKSWIEKLEKLSM